MYKGRLLLIELD